MLKHLQRLNKVEKIAVAFLGVLALATGIQVLHAFYVEQSDTSPEKGGIYVEADVGKADLINPLFAHPGSLTNDLSLLVFSGLTKYDPASKEIVPDLADFKISTDGRTYTFILNENATWHDGQPVTSNDVLFTYQSVLQNPNFRGTILNTTDFGGMKLFKEDGRTVKFVLEKPDSFFLVKTLVGLLPEHLLAPEPVESLAQAPFNQAPVGSGPYRFVSMLPEDHTTVITLQNYDGYYGIKPHIPTLQFRVYASTDAMMQAQGDVDGLRTVPDERQTPTPISNRFNLIRYYLPQYVAAFLNNDSPMLKNKAIRMALQLGTDKNALAQILGQNRTLDTPLLEIDQRNWVYVYSVLRANKTLDGTEWISEVVAPKTEEPKEPDPNDTSAVTYINNPNGGKDWSTSDTKVTLSGTVPGKTKAVFVDDYELKKFVPGDAGWSYVASLDLGNLKKGTNIFRVYVEDFSGKKSQIDAITIAQATSLEMSETELQKVQEENEIAPDIPTRKNKDGAQLVLRVLAPQQPEAYGTVAQLLSAQWRKLGVKAFVEILPNDQFQTRLAKRDYDVLIFGQSLGYNLDAYPYWHSSQAKENGFNLSQFKNFAVDSLLEKARQQTDAAQRKKTLSDIQEIMSQEAPAIFLYSPVYRTALSDKIQNASFENLATISDRFSRISDWYANYTRNWKDGVTPLTFLKWIPKQF